MAFFGVDISNTTKFDDDNLRYVRVRRKGKKSPLTPWSKTIPIGVKRTTNINPPSIVEPSEVTIEFDTNTQDTLTLKMSGYVDNGVAWMTDLEYEVYDGFETNNNKILTKIIPGTDLDNSYIRITGDDLNMLANTRNKECYIRARYKDQFNRYSAWTDLVLVKFV